MTLNLKKNYIKIYFNSNCRRNNSSQIQNWRGWANEVPGAFIIWTKVVAAAFPKIVKKTDYAIGTHRGHAHYLAKGGTV